MRQVATEMWPLFRSAACEVLILNGALTAAPEILREVKKISKGRLVILADDFTSGLPKCKASIVTVTKDHRKPGLFRMSIRRSG
jgi:hypothetical protein